MGSTKPRKSNKFVMMMISIYNLMLFVFWFDGSVSATIDSHARVNKNHQNDERYHQEQEQEQEQEQPQEQPQHHSFFSAPSVLQRNGMDHPRQLHDNRPDPMTRRKLTDLLHHSHPVGRDWTDRLNDLRHVNYQNHPYDYNHDKDNNEDDKLYQDDHANRKYKRRLEELKKNLTPIRIHFDTTELESWSENSETYAKKIRYLKTKVLPGMAQVWSSALQVIPISSESGLQLDYNWCPFGDKESSPSFQDGGVTNTDLVIFVTANSDVCSGGSTLASAYSCFWDQYERPTGGNIDFCLETIELDLKHEVIDHNIVDHVVDVNSGKNLTAIQQQQPPPPPEPFPQSPQLNYRSQKILEHAIGTAVHELSHVLGITSSDMLFFYDWETGKPRTISPELQQVECVTGTTETRRMPSQKVMQAGQTHGGAKYYEITTPRVVQVARNQFNCPTMTGARLENQPTNGDCFGSHFDERLYFAENMSPVIGDIAELLTSLTLSALHDSGWYIPNYAVADNSPFGANAGCDFVDKPCIINGEVPSYSKGYFCNEEYLIGQNGKFMGKYGCDPTHTHIAACDLVDYRKSNKGRIPPSLHYRNFPSNPFLGAVTRTADYCPTFSLEPSSCHDTSNKPKLPLMSEGGALLEYYGSDSKCFHSNLNRPICLKSRCDTTNRKLIFMSDDNEYVCNFDGEIITTAKSLNVECPKLSAACPNLICPSNCSGNGICDYSGDYPVCKCFDNGDTSEGCYGNYHKIAGKTIWQDAVSTSTKMSSITIICMVQSLLLYSLFIER